MIQVCLGVISSTVYLQPVEATLLFAVFTSHTLRFFSYSLERNPHLDLTLPREPQLPFFVKINTNKFH